MLGKDFKMWPEPQKEGKIKYRKRYVNPLTGKICKVSTTITPEKKGKPTRSERNAAEQTLDAKIQKKLAELESPEKKEYCMEELTSMYLEDRKDEWKESSYHTNEIKFNKLVDIIGKDVLVDRLNQNVIESRIKKYSSEASTRNRYISATKTLLRWAFRKDYVEDIRYLDKIESFKEKSYREKIQDKFLEPQELTMLINSLPNERYKLLTRFLAFSGLRFGEMAALTKKDVDFANQCIHITKTYSCAVHKNMDTPKSYSSQRDIHMQPELLQVCKEITTFVRLDSVARGYRTDIFFPSIHGTSQINDVFGGYLKSHKPETINKLVSAHTLRHTHVSLLAGEGVPLDTISRRLGHESDKLTRQIYLHITEKMIERDNEMLDKVKIL